MNRLRSSSIWLIAALALVWAISAPSVAAQDAETGLSKWFDFSAIMPKDDAINTPGLLGEAVPPAVLLLDLSVPPGIVGAVPFGESAIYAPTSKITNQPGATMSFLRQDASIGGPLYSTEHETLVGYVDARSIQYNTNAFLTYSNRPFPSDLYDVTLGLSYTHKSDDGWMIGGGVSIGSPSDHPFESFRVIFPSLSAFARAPAAREGDGWLYSLTWVPVSLIRFPLPGIAYEWNASEKLQIVAGIPFSIVWRPTETLRLDVGFMPPYQTRAQITWKMCDWIESFVGFESVNDTYMLADRVHRRDLFYSYEKRAPLGLRFNVGKHAVLDVGGGYMFDRIFFTSRSFTNESHDRLHIAPGGYGMVRFAVKF